MSAPRWNFQTPGRRSFSHFSHVTVHAANLSVRHAKLLGSQEPFASMNATELVIDSADATMASQLDWERKDPFGRMIVAQAARRGLTIATSDSQLIHGALTPVLVTR